MTKLTRLFPGLLAAAVFGTSVCHAQEPGSDALSAACNRVLLDTVQERSRVCVIGVVEPPTEIQVLFSNEAEVTFELVEVFASPLQQGREEPLPQLAHLTGQLAVGGFENGKNIYSAQLPSPKPNP